MATLLVVGDDIALLETRAMVLRTATGAATACSSTSAALAILADGQFDLVVLCHSVPEPHRSSLAKYIRVRWPQTRIMQLVPAHQGVGDVDPAVDAISSSTPEDLVLNIKKQLKLMGQALDHSELQSRLRSPTQAP